MKRSTNLGDVLIRMGKITQANLQDAIGMQKAWAEKGDQQQIGQVFLALKLVTAVDLERALAYQERMQGDDPVGALVDIVREVQNVALPAYMARRAS